MIISGLSKSESFQEDIGTYFQEHHPDLLQVVLFSSGDMHNPKIAPSIVPFMRVFPETRVIRNVFKQLEEFGYMVKDIYHEEFRILKIGTSLLFSAVIYLNIEEKSLNHSLQINQAKKVSEFFKLNVNPIMKFSPRIIIGMVAVLVVVTIGFVGLTLLLVVGDMCGNISIANTCLLISLSK